MVTVVASYLRDFDLKSASVLLLGALLLCPIAALAVLALGDSEGIATSFVHRLGTIPCQYGRLDGWRRLSVALFRGGSCVDCVTLSVGFIALV